MGTYTFFGYLGMLIYTFAGGQMFDTVHKSAPFVYLGIMDTILVLLVFTLMACGKFNH